MVKLSMKEDIFGKALWDFHQRKFKPPLLLHNEYGPPERIPVEGYFSSEDEWSEIETYALDLSKGKILDIGAAAGRHALWLQARSRKVTALDISPLCGKIMNKRGVKDVVTEDIYEFDSHGFDTILMLMNGLGVAGNMEGLEKLFSHLKDLLAPGGQLIADSSDITYLYEEKPAGNGKYFGELSFQYEYKAEKSAVFSWLYIDQETLIKTARRCGWVCQIIFEDEADAFLARLQLN